MPRTDIDRLDWLEKNEADLTTSYDGEEGSLVLTWLVTPMWRPGMDATGLTIRDAIDAAMDKDPTDATE